MLSYIKKKNESSSIQIDGLLFFPSFNFKPSNPAQLPWQSNPVQLVFWYCKVLKPSCRCDLTAVAAPSQVAAFLGESFQIKTFSQKTLKLCCRQDALPSCFILAFEAKAWREHNLALRMFVMMSVLPNIQHFLIGMHNKCVIVSTSVFISTPSFTPYCFIYIEWLNAVKCSFWCKDTRAGLNGWKQVPPHYSLANLGI